MSEYTTQEHEYGWDDEITQSGSGDWTLLPAGKYPFTVLSFERGRFNGSAKLPPCNMATLKIQVDGGAQGKVTLDHRLYLHSKTEGLLSAFFESVGLKKKDEPMRMNWAAVPGAHGLCKLEIHEWTKKDGTPGQSNQIQKFLPPEEPKFAPQQAWQKGAF